MGVPQKQVSAYCLPQSSQELIEFMHAVGWELFELLAIKLLDWMSRWVNNKNLSPAMVETKKDTNQVRMADWGSVWVCSSSFAPYATNVVQLTYLPSQAAYTEAWIDPSFDFVIGKTSPKAPQGTKHLPPRAPVPRVYKSAGAMVAAAANDLVLTADSKRGKAIAGNFMCNFIVGGKEENFEQESAVDYNVEFIDGAESIMFLTQAKAATGFGLHNSGHLHKSSLFVDDGSSESAGSSNGYAEPIFISIAQAKTPTTSKIRNSAHCQKTMSTASKVHHKPI
ncbi:unnamed protein product [Zymoseptoria tritici ST99CH_3D1]|nr:unnamed protein product [Zymoseptoria tritici ST99CH_3D1]